MFLERKKTESLNIENSKYVFGHSLDKNYSILSK